MTAERVLTWDFDGTLAFRPGQWAGVICEVVAAARHDLGMTHPEVNTLVTTSPKPRASMSCQALVDAKADIVMLAGFMMPKFGGQGMCGLNVHRAVLAAGDTPETLAERVQTRERVLVVEVLGDVARGRLRLPTS